MAGDGGGEAVGRSSRAAADRAEPRALRTRSRVLTAIRTAAEEGDLDRLTVSEVCRRAEIHRVTFYSHWTELGDAVTDAFTELVDGIAEVSEDAILAATDVHDLASLYADALVAQLAEVRLHRSVYRELFGSGSHAFRASLEASLQVRAALAVDAMVRAGMTVPGATDGAAAAYLAGGVAAAFERFAGTDEEDLQAAAAVVAAQLPRWWPSA